jgi:hypothetical protein
MQRPPLGLTSLRPCSVLGPWLQVLHSWELSEESSCCSVAWDPLSDHYLLACSSAGHMALYDVQAGQQVGSSSAACTGRKLGCLGTQGAGSVSRW